MNCSLSSIFVTCFHGILTSTVYDRQESVILPRGETAEALGYRMMWEGERTFNDGTSIPKTAYDIYVTAADNKTKPIGTGPFRVTNARHGERVDMVRHDSPAVYHAIERANPFAAEVRERFFALTDQARKEIDDA